MTIQVVDLDALVLAVGDVELWGLAATPVDEHGVRAQEPSAAFLTGQGESKVPRLSNRWTKLDP